MLLTKVTHLKNLVFLAIDVCETLNRCAVIVLCIILLKSTTFSYYILDEGFFSQFVLIRKTKFNI